MRTESKTRKGDREIISVSLPIDVYNKLTSVCLLHGYNRSALIALSVIDFLRNFKPADIMEVSNNGQL